MSDIVERPEPYQVADSLLEMAQEVEIGKLQLTVPLAAFLRESADVINLQASEIERLRAVVERQRHALSSIRNEILYGGTDFNDEPDIDRIHDFTTVGLRDTANTTANTPNPED